ncbi:MAG: PRC-barrel domain-containing protein [Chloroflexi bacterium]|nr:PRC-barrel domain-containing protein [Chloroflexota bacterium]
MRIHIGATVRTREGDEMGKVERVMLNPTTKDVDALVVHRGLILGRDVVVRISLVQEADQAEVRLRIGRDRLEELPDFEGRHHELVPVEDAESYSVYAPGTILFPLVPPYGVPGEPGPYEFPEEEREAAPVDLDVVEGMLVRSLDGTVGVVEEVRTDPLSDRATSIVVTGGAGLKKDVEIPFEFVAGIFPDHIDVSLTNQQVEDLPLPVTDRYVTSERQKRRRRKS